MSRFRDRIDDPLEAPGGAGIPAIAAGGGNLRQLGRETNDLLDTGDAAIERALSRNSDQYLQSHRQTGGQ